MPVHDPQFWIVTAAALVGLWTLLRQFRPSRSDEGPACGGCAAGAAACAKPRTTEADAPGAGSGLVRIGRH